MHPAASIRRTHARLTESQKAEHRHRKQVLTDDLTTAKQSYEEEATNIAQRHGR